METRLTSIDRYEVEGILGEGGMGVVYDARDPRLDRRVAVKTLKPGAMSREEALERFRREAEISANLRNPHVITIYDFGTDPSAGPYLVMERVSGRSLADAVKEDGALDADTVLPIISEIASALEAAHRTGVCHRDVKAENILLAEDGSCRLTDFGIARRHDSSLTTTSAIPGTPSILAPEILDGNTPSPASDQFSLAVVAATALGGAAPFHGETITQLLYRIAQAPPQLAPTLSRGVRAVLERALAKNPARRYESVTAFAEALERANRGLIDSTIIRPWGKRGKYPPAGTRTSLPARLWPATAIVFTVVVLTIGITRFWTTESNRPGASSAGATHDQDRAEETAEGTSKAEAGAGGAMDPKEKSPSHQGSIEPSRETSSSSGHVNVDEPPPPPPPVTPEFDPGEEILSVFRNISSATISGFLKRDLNEPVDADTQDSEKESIGKGVPTI